MTPFKKIYETDDYQYDPNEECASCGGDVRRSEAFKEDYAYYHADCAGVYQCGNCGKWNEKAQDVCECGEKKE